MVDLTINANPRTILLKGRNIHEERVAAGTITPGHFLQLNSAGTVQVNSTALVDKVRIVAVENELEGLGIDDNYAANDLVQYEILHGGMEVNALVAAAAPAIVIGDSLELAADGTVRKLTTGVCVAQAIQAVDNSGGGSPARIRIVMK
jgi:hypothetical protein